MPVSLALALFAAMAMAAVPIAAMAALAMSNAAQPGPTLLAMTVVAAAALVIGAAWARDQANLLEHLRAADAAHTATPAQMRLRPNSVLIREIGRLVRTLTERAAVLERRLLTEEAIVEALPDPMIVLAADRSVMRANAAARAAFGTDMPAVLRHPGLRGAIDRTLAQGTAQTAEVSLPVPVAQEVYATVFALAQAGANQGGTRIAAVLSNRTRERAIERMRADFVANASHELRTPLASLIGFIDTLRGPAADDPPAQARFLQIMAEQAHRMNRLIDDLLSLSRIELTEHQPPIGQVGVANLARWVAAAFEPQVIARGITLQVVAEDGLPAVSGDEDQLAQVLQNLLDNAVKYGREGGVVRVVVTLCAAGGRWPSRPGVSVAVSDDGHGIPREHLPRLTERFYRVDRGRSRAVGGTGLGLAIVKHIVNRHRGQLAIDSQEGQGATFTVWLPLVNPTALEGARRLPA